MTCLYSRTDDRSAFPRKSEDTVNENSSMSTAAPPRHSDTLCARRSRRKELSLSEQPWPDPGDRPQAAGAHMNAPIADLAVEVVDYVDDACPLRGVKPVP